MSVRKHTQLTLADWLKAGRVQTAMVTALALWMGYVTVEPMTTIPFLGLGGIGLLIHIWGFMLNEVHDAEYDKKYSEVDGHPLAEHQIERNLASRIAWTCGGLAIIFSFMLFDSLLGNSLILLSFLAGTMYNTYSKKHWWSNLYLSLWVLLIALSGAAFAGSFSIYTWVLASALAIQIFVQVIEGDMKDILGPEKTLAEKMGVTCDQETKIVTYPDWFKRVINTVKMIELALVSFVVYVNFTDAGMASYIALTIFIIFASLFTASSAYYLTSHLDRSKIKKRSSIHELSAVLMLGTSAYWLHNSSALFIALTPVVWYALTNKLLHSGTLNPDI